MATGSIDKEIWFYQKQLDFLHDRHTFRAFSAGIGSGKSFIGAYDMIRRARPNRLYMVVAPTYTLLADASFRTLHDLAVSLGLLAHASRGGSPYVKLKTGAEILFRSAHESRYLRGPNLSGIWLDEASVLKTRESYDILIGRLREGGEQGWLTATFTPAGTAHWTYNAFAHETDDTKLFRAATRDNPFLPPGFVDKVRRQYTALQAQQELDGIFLDGIGNQFCPANWPRYVEIGDGSLSTPGFPRTTYARHQYQILIAFDWAMGKRKKATSPDAIGGQQGDYTAFVVAALTDDGKLFILEVVNERIRLEDNAPALAALCRKWKPHIVAGDDDMLSETMALDCRRHRDIPELKRMEIAGRDKLTRAQAAIIHGENQRIYIPYIPAGRPSAYPWYEVFIDQLAGFTGIDDQHDDMVDGLSILGRLADELKGDGSVTPMPVVLTPARDLFAWSDY